MASPRAERCSEILGGWLFLADMGVALHPPPGITHIVNATNRCVPNAFESPNSANRICQYYNVDLDDKEGEPIEDHFEGVAAFIEGARRQDPGRCRVLVHCMCGVSRSATLVVGYLMQHADGLAALCDAFAHVQARRPVIAPNPTFAIALQRRELELAARRKCVVASGEQYDLAQSSLAASAMVSKNWHRAKDNARKARGALDGLGSDMQPMPWRWRGAALFLVAVMLALSVLLRSS